MSVLFHHCRSLESIEFGEMEADPEYADSDLKHAYEWLEKQVGFYPLFLAVGETEEDIRMTGYQNQWRKLMVVGRNYREHRKRGEFPNHVLFSFEDIDGVFMDYDNWHIVLNGRPTDYEKRLIFKPSWPISKWLLKAKRESHTVQLVAPRLHLPSANMIWARNQQTKKILESMGFENVIVKRIPLEGPENV